MRSNLVALGLCAVLALTCAAAFAASQIGAIANRPFIVESGLFKPTVQAISQRYGTEKRRPSNEAEHLTLQPFRNIDAFAVQADPTRKLDSLEIRLYAADGNIGVFAINAVLPDRVRDREGSVSQDRVQFCGNQPR